MGVEETSLCLFHRLDGFSCYGLRHPIVDVCIGLTSSYPQPRHLVFQMLSHKGGISAASLETSPVQRVTAKVLFFVTDHALRRSIGCHSITKRGPPIPIHFAKGISNEAPTVVVPDTGRRHSHPHHFRRPRPGSPTRRHHWRLQRRHLHHRSEQERRLSRTSGYQGMVGPAVTPAASPAASASPAKSTTDVTPAKPAKPATVTPAAPAASASTAASSSTAAAKTTTHASTATMAQAPGGGPGMVWFNSDSNVYHCPGTSSTARPNRALNVRG